MERGRREGSRGCDQGKVKKIFTNYAETVSDNDSAAVLCGFLRSDLHRFRYGPEQEDQGAGGICDRGGRGMRAMGRRR